MSTYPISIVTPWRNHPELIPAYERAVRGAQVILVDNASAPENARLLDKLARRLGALCLRSEENLSYGAACNLGMTEANRAIRVCLNNDIYSVGDWLGAVTEDVTDAGLFGREMPAQMIDGVVLPFISGWCLACSASTWETLGGYDTAALPGNYWEDNDLCFRAIVAGLKLHLRAWPIVHLGGRTAKVEPRAYETVPANRAAFIERVRAWGRTAQ